LHPPGRRSRHLGSRRDGGEHRRAHSADPCSARIRAAGILMPAFPLDPAHLQIAAPALALGLIVGILLTWLVARRKRLRLQSQIDRLSERIKDQERSEEHTSELQSRENL